VEAGPTYPDRAPGTLADTRPPVHPLEAEKGPSGGARARCKSF